MKRKFKLQVSLLLVFLFGSVSLHAQNPYKSLGVEMETLTLSKGKYIEFFTNDSLVRIGSIILDTRNYRISSFVLRDTIYSEANLEPEVSSRFLQTDPYASLYPSLSPYVYVSNNPLVFKDSDGKVIRDKDGNIVFVASGSPVTVTHPGGRSAEMQMGYIFADDGTKIEVYQNLSTDKGFDCDCHGVTFADGDYWINNDQVVSLLAGDDYKNISSLEDAQVGDVAIYSDKNGEVQHSVTIVKIDPETGEITVEGLGGLEVETHRDNLHDAWPVAGTQIYIFRKDNPDKIASDKEIEALKEKVNDEND